MKKKLMILLIATLFITMIFSTGCKKKFDINGMWTVNVTWFNPTFDGSYTITFTGDKASGTFIANTSTGTYTVNDKNVSWVFMDSGTMIATYTGTSTDDNTMSGTMFNNSGRNGSWAAVR